MNRYKSSLPKLGIRIIVDGRCNGVRDKIEASTRRLAENVKELVESNIKHSSGDKLEAVISKVGVGGVAEQDIVREQFEKENVGLVISVTKAWAYGSEVILMDKTIPQAIWGFNGSERPGAVFLAGATACSEQKGIPVFKIYGHDVQDATDESIPEDVKEQILHFTKCALAVAEMKDKSYLSIGGTCMGIGGSIVQPENFQKYFGMRNEAVDMSEIIRRIEKGIYDKEEFKKAMLWVKENCIEMKDPNPEEIQQSREKKDEVWEYVVKMFLICRDLMVGNEKLKDNYYEESCGHNAICAGFQGQRQWTDFLPNGDFAEAILNSSFDWNGIREPYITATENDSLNGMSLLLGHLVSDRAQIFADVRTYWSKKAIERVTGKDAPEALKNGFIYLTNSGAAALDGSGEMLDQNNEHTIKPFYDMDERDVDCCLKATKWGAGKLATFRGGGFSSAYNTHGGMPMTMIRLNSILGLGLCLQIVEGYSVDLTEDVEKIIVGRTDPTWPKTFFVPRLNDKAAFKDVYTVMKKWGSNHCAISYGHIGSKLITLASMLRIPVSMHNVDDEDIVRPAMWDGFGMDLDAADYMACKTLGPLY